MAKQTVCIALLCVIFVGAVSARPTYDEPPHYEGEGYKGPRDEYRSEYHPKDDYYAYDKDEHYVTLTLQEAKIQDYTRVSKISTQYTSLFTCPSDDTAEHPQECGLTKHGYHNEDSHDFFSSSLMPEYAGQCTVTVTEMDPRRETTLCSMGGCVQVTTSCTLFHAAKKCGCPIPTGVSFNATGAIVPFKAASCTPSYAPKPAGQQRVITKEETTKETPGTAKTMAANGADYYHAPRNNTIYEGTALSAQLHVTDCQTGHPEVDEQLHKAKLVYIGGFIDSKPVQLPEEEYEYDSYAAGHHLPPFITPGSLKLVLKK